MVWDERVAAFVASLLGFERGFGPCQALGFLDREGTLIAGAVFHNWQPECGVIEVSGASLRPWATRARLQAVGSYVFGDLGCQMAVARIAESNTRARALWRKAGADEFVIPRLRGDEAECVETLTVEQWQEWWNGWKRAEGS